ncbi:MAG: putative transposase [Longimicrobiales bacterium]
MPTRQREHLRFPSPESGTVFVNDRVSYRTEGTARVISVHGVVFAHYDTSDRVAEAYAMVTLVESGYADQNDVARCFGCSTRSLRRYQAHYAAAGLTALLRPPGRPPANGLRSARSTGRARTILRLKTTGLSNRGIGGKLGVDEKVVRRALRQLGWRPCPADPLPFVSETECPSPHVTIEPPTPIAPPGLKAALVPSSLDIDPLDRSMDRLLAAMGALDDAAPLFAPASGLPRAGVLLAVPSLVSSGLLAVADKVYGSIGPAFYGLRTTLVASVLLALLRIPRAETLKEYAPADLGRIVGLDRMPEVKTLRRKLARLAALKGSERFGRALAERRVRERGRVGGFLYIDGHVRAYHGQRTIPKAYLTRTRLAVPATTDYWVNDRRGDPLFVVTADANAAMTRMLVPILEQVRGLIGPRRRPTIVFDRGGWSPKLFKQLLAMDFDILTYRKGRVRRVAEKRFVVRDARFDGRWVRYRLHDQPVRFLRGTLRLRQVTRLQDGHQTPVLTSRWDLRDIAVAYRMFERWRQENFFKYMRDEFLLDALIDYQVEPDDPARSVPNPARKAVEKERRTARARLKNLQEAYAGAALDYVEGRSPTMRAFSAAERRIRRDIDDLKGHIATLAAQHHALPARVTVAEARHGEEPVKLSTERKHLTNVLKLVSFQIESDLVELIRPHYARTDEEGRTLIQTALQSAAAIEPTADDLHVTLAPLSSSHRSQAVAALCRTLNETATPFPGTMLRMRFAVAEA